MKSVLWRVVKGLSYTEDARCRKFKSYTCKSQCNGNEKLKFRNNCKVALLNWEQFQTYLLELSVDFNRCFLTELLDSLNSACVDASTGLYGLQSSVSVMEGRSSRSTLYSCVLFSMK